MIDAPVKPLDDIAARLDAIVASPDGALVASAPSLADELLALGGNDPGALALGPTA